MARHSTQKKEKFIENSEKVKSHLRITVILNDCVIMLCLLPHKPENRIPSVTEGSKSI